jgi:hypothetical protein
MTDADLNKAIEVAEEAVAGFADDDSFEQLLALAVLELRDRLNNEREACAKIVDVQNMASKFTYKEQLETKDEPVATVISESGANVTHSWWHEPALPIGTKLYIKEKNT